MNIRKQEPKIKQEIALWQTLALEVDTPLITHHGAIRHR